MLPEIQDQLNEQAQQFTGVPINQEKRTLLLLGPSRAGKSTISQVLRNSYYEPPEPRLYSATRQPEHHTVGSLQIIDMPGFCDTQPRSSNFKLPDKNILSMLDSELDEADLIAFVFSLANGIDEAAIASMRLFQSKFPQFTNKMMLVITHAEEMDEGQRLQLVEDFFCHKKIIKYRLREFFQQGVHFLGSIRYESIQQNNTAAIAREHRNVLQMRQQLIDKCFQARIVSRTYKIGSKYSIKMLRPMIILFGVIVPVSIACVVKLLVKDPMPVIQTTTHRQDTNKMEVIPNDQLDEIQTKNQQALEETLKNVETRLKYVEDRLNNAEERFEERFNSITQSISQLQSSNTFSKNITEAIDKDELMEEDSIQNNSQDNLIGRFRKRFGHS